MNLIAFLLCVIAVILFMLFLRSFKLGDSEKHHKEMIEAIESLGQRFEDEIMESTQQITGHLYYTDCLNEDKNWHTKGFVRSVIDPAE